MKGHFATLCIFYMQGAQFSFDASFFFLKSVVVTGTIVAVVMDY